LRQETLPITLIRASTGKEKEEKQWADQEDKGRDMGRGAVRGGQERRMVCGVMGGRGNRGGYAGGWVGWRAAGGSSVRAEFRSAAGRPT
jgi:hypothetical protein